MIYVQLVQWEDGDLVETARGASPERRERIIEAARFLALRQGLRSVTMEAIAREARIAKPTLYSYFSDKDAVYLAVMEEVIEELKRAFFTGLDGEGSVIARVARALTAKHLAIKQVLEGSAHADEIYSEHDRSAGPQFRALEAMMEEAVARELSRAGVGEARGLTRVLMAASYGLGLKVADSAEIAAGIGLVVERVLGPEVR
jgi:AcrR family transcriptional regulator